jgi:ADP-heptose:LPS heptosyltransferase
VVVAGDLVETLQAAPLLGALHAAGNGRVLLAAPPVASRLGGAMVGADELALVPALGGTARLLDGVVSLRRRRLDAVFLCSSRPRDRLLVYGAGVARRLGPGRGPFAHLLTTTVADPPDANRELVWLRLAAELGFPVGPDPRGFDPGEMARRTAEGLLLGGGFEDGRPLVVLVPRLVAAVPGVEPDRLRWNPERFAHLANQLGQRYGAGVVLLGEVDDRPLIDAVLIDCATPVLDLSGKLNLVEMAAVAERCDLLIACDSPLLHLAAAVGTPTVGLFGPSDGRRRGPHGTEHRVLQALPTGSLPGPVQRIRVDDALAAIESQLA